MKKYLLVIAIFFCFVKAQSQAWQYHPMPDSNAIWNETYSYYSPNCDYHYLYDLFVSGDTVVGLHTYHKLYKTGSFYSSLCPNNYNYTNQYWGLIRQDTLQKKVFTSYNESDTLVYDFNLSLGDTLGEMFTQNGNANYISKIDSVFMGTSYRKRFWVSLVASTSGSPPYCSVVEGMGSNYGLFAKLIPSGADFIQELNRFCYNSHELYPDTTNLYCSTNVEIQELVKDDEYTISPNPFGNEIIVLGSEMENSQLLIYNVLGELVFEMNDVKKGTIINTTFLPKGIYFVKIISDKKMATKKIIKE